MAKQVRLPEYPLEKANKGSAQLIRQINEDLLLQTLLLEGPLSQPQLVGRTGLRAPTVMRLIASLQKNALVRPIGQAPANSKGGRRPTIWEFNPRAGYAVGVDFEWLRTTVVVTDLLGQAITAVTSPTPSSQGANVVLEHIAHQILEVIQVQKLSSDKLIGVGVGVPGIVDAKQGIGRFYGRIPGWQDIPAKHILQRSLHLPITVEQNCRAQTYSYLRFGPASNSDNGVYIFLRAGIAGAIVEHGRLLTGSTGSAGEIGHMTVIPSGGERCWCGNTGCFETVASENAVVSHMKAYLAKGRPTIVRELLQAEGRDLHSLTVSHVIQAAQQGDMFARRTLIAAAEAIGFVLAGLINILNPDFLAVVGYVADIAELVRPIILRVLQERAMRLPREAASLWLLPSDQEAGARGAAALAINQRYPFFERPLANAQGR